MKLITKEIKKKIPRIYEQEKEGDEAVAFVKFFCPWNNWKWYATEYDPEEKLFFGFVSGEYDEWGSFSLKEMESVRGPFGLRIERDLYFKPKKVSDIMTLKKSHYA